MALEAVAEGLSAIGRFIFRILCEVLVEFLCKGIGYLIWKPFKPSVNPDGALVAITGIVFWLLIFILSYQVYAFIGIDSCLDSGGRYNYNTNACEK